MSRVAGMPIVAQGARVRIPLYPKQRDFIVCPKPVRGFTGGRGSGKTTTGAIDLLLRSKANCLYMVVAPSYKMMDRATFRTFKEGAERLGVWPGDEGHYKQERRVVGRNGAEYLFCSADDPESLRGPNASGAWLDEVQDVEEEAYRNVRGCLRQHGRMGWVTATFTPGSPDHWTSKEFISNPDTARAAFFRASLIENAFTDEDYYQSQLANFAASPLALRREVHGECVFLEGAEWLPEYFQNCWFDEWPDPARGGIKVIALDSSKGKGGKTGDYSAFVKLLWVDGLLYADADMRNDRDGSMISQTGVELFKEWQPHYFVVEEEMGQDLLIADMHRIADEQRIVMPLTPMGTDKINKEVRIRRLTPYVSRRQFRYKSNSPGAKMLVDQMMAFPQAEHDDGPDALEYSVRLLVKATTGLILPPRAVYGHTSMGATAA
jgi:phage terminase large subunit-like protein